MHSHAIYWRHRGLATLKIPVLRVHEIRILPPTPYLSGFHVPLDDIAVVALGSSQGDLAIDGSENVIITDVAIVRAGQ